MIIKNTSLPRYLYNWSYFRGQDTCEFDDYTILAERTVTKVVTPRLPLTTYADSVEGGYLKDYAQFYRPEISPFGRYYLLKDEYKGNRPTYSIEVTFKRYDIELTEQGTKRARGRYESHKRNLETYARLLGIEN